jgi:hypothetical protein
MTSGCSFRGPVPQPGEITAIAIEPAKINQVSKIKATVKFVGSFEAPTLQATFGEGSNVLKVQAFGTPPLPPLGLGIIPVDRTSVRVVEIEAALSPPRAGVFEVQGLSGNDARITYTSQLVVTE